ncbi:hypothetical protein WJT74_07850 [Sphingomicrobium sp. XHP0239]|uniref:hypothetical protein n=1 Tax=Sphingomicrobium maritimum TaxID=3133972 RepID=UPI0031CC728C
MKFLTAMLVAVVVKPGCETCDAQRQFAGRTVEIEAEDLPHDECFVFKYFELLLDLAAALFRLVCSISKRRGLSVPEAQLGVLQHRSLRMLRRFE